MAVDLVDRHIFLMQDIHADLQRSHCRVKVGPHEVGKRKSGIRFSHEEEPSFVEVRHAFAGEVVVAEKVAAVVVASEGCLKQLGEKCVGVDREAEFAQGLPDQFHPGVDVGSAVVAVHHRDRLACRRRHHIDLFVLFQLFVSDDHGEIAGSRTDIAGPYADRIRRDHAGPGVAFTGSDGDPRFQFSGRIKIQRAVLSQHAGGLARQFDLGQHGEKVKTCALVELPDHFFVVAELLGIDREHTARLADPHESLSGQDKVDISGQSSDISDVFHMLFFVQDRLIKVSDGPSLRNIEVEQFAQFLCRFLCNGVSPGSEFTQLPVIFVKGQIAVHHSGNADRPGGRQHCIILLQYILFELRKAVLKAQF